VRSSDLMQRVAGTAPRPREERRPAPGSPPGMRLTTGRVPAREAAAVVVALALVSLALPIRWAAQSGWDAVHALARPAPPAAERDVGSALGGLLNGPLLTAARTIPRDATFSVRVSFDPPIPPAYTEAAIGLFRYWLLPRRFTDDAHAADWIITFHHPTSTLGVRIARIVRLGRYTDAVEVAH